MSFSWIPAAFAGIIAYLLYQYLYNIHLAADDKMAQSIDPRPESCVFCKIAAENGSEIIYQDESLVAFRDIKPSTSHHYLIVPRNHLPNVKFLTSEHVNIIKRMLEFAKEVISKQGGDEDNSIYGFHWHPFNSVAHLHLHAISNLEEMSWMGKFTYKPKSYWFVKPEDVVLILENKKI